MLFLFLGALIVQSVPVVDEKKIESANAIVYQHDLNPKVEDVLETEGTEKEESKVELGGTTTPSPVSVSTKNEYHHDKSKQKDQKNINRKQLVKEQMATIVHDKIILKRKQVLKKQLFYKYILMNKSKSFGLQRSFQTQTIFRQVIQNRFHKIQERDPMLRRMLERTPIGAVGMVQRARKKQQRQQFWN